MGTWAHLLYPRVLVVKSLALKAVMDAKKSMTISLYFILTRVLDRMSMIWSPIVRPTTSTLTHSLSFFLFMINALL